MTQQTTEEQTTIHWQEPSGNRGHSFPLARSLAVRVAKLLKREYGDKKRVFLVYKEDGTEEVL